MRMELSWISKIRLLTALAIGTVLVGLLPWDKIAPANNGTFILANSNITPFHFLVCSVLAIIASFIASIVSTPLGLQIGILAVPAGMAVWAFKSAELSTLFQAEPAATARFAILHNLRFEGFVWLSIVLAGFVGAFAADKLFRRKQLELHDKFNPQIKLQPLAANIITIIATVVVGSLLLNILAADISYPDSKIGSVTGQPSNLQIAFAVIVTFMACSFAAKLFLGANYIWTIIAIPFLTSYIITIYAKLPTLEYMANSWPAVYFSKPAMSVLPIQMAAFGTIGSVWGYWLAVRYHFWREFES